MPKICVELGVLAISIGLGATAGLTIASPYGALGIRTWVVALPMLGAALLGFGPLYRPSAETRAAAESLRGEMAVVWCLLVRA